MEAFGANAIYFSDGYTYDIRRFTPDGRLDRIFRPQLEVPALTDELIDGFVAWTLDYRLSSRNSRTEARRRYAAMPFPETPPAYSRLMVDAEDAAWATGFDVSPEAVWGLSSGPTRWAVADASGRAFGVITTPERFTVFEIGADYVLGVGEGELDVERVVMYDLIKP